jgi:acetyltransferase-like isoleucine patch superfamily enzyme
MKNAIIILVFLVSKTFAQSSTLLPNAIQIANVSALGTCNVAAKGTQVFNTTDSKMYFCNGTMWVNLTGEAGTLTLPYSGNGSIATPVSLFTLTNNGTAPVMSLKNTGIGAGINIETTSGRPINAISASGVGIRAQSSENFGVYGLSTSSVGVYGSSDSYYGVYGISSTNIGVYGVSSGNFSGYFNGKARVGSNLAIGSLSYSQTIARLHIKAGSDGGWGQHIRLENGTDTGYGEILHDDDGLKFRNFQAGESFIFRNADNTTIASISALGNLTINKDATIGGNVSIDGNLTSNGKGNVVSSSATQQKIVYFSGGFSFGLLAGTYIDGDILYENFGGIPKVMIAQVENGTGDWHKVLATPFNVKTNGCSIRFSNVSNSTINLSGTWHFTIIGPK